MKFRPELLMPAGSTETFFAAIEGGADAVYLGVKNFNARSRAKNFSINDVFNLVVEAHKRNVKVYVTLNTLIKNSEIFDLLDTIHYLNQCKVDAIIFQDLSVLSIVKKFYRNLELHASTQFGVHNSVGANFLQKKGVPRVILSRELSLDEISALSNNKNQNVDLEIFVHGALCYSFSGQCLFSSYLGGFSANRGMCAQVCRRSFDSNNQKSNIFSLKDLQLIDYIPAFAKQKISSLKVEGRMKSPDYVYNTARAYRLAIDDNSKIENAKEILKFDYAREKTAWFVANDLKDSITDRTGTGLFAGKIEEIATTGFYIRTEHKITDNHKLRIRDKDDENAFFVNVKSVDVRNNKLFVHCDTQNLNVGSDVYIAATQKHDFISGFKSYVNPKLNFLTVKQKQALLKSYKLPHSKTQKAKLFLRIDNSQLTKVRNFTDFDRVFVKFDLRNAQDLLETNFDRKTMSIIIPELPKFISELQIERYKELLKQFFARGYKAFCVNHISQVDLLPNNADFCTSESVYALNDIAINFIKGVGAKEYIYPYENDYPNMLKGQDRNGIVPIYYYPELFYSRMPVKSTDTLRDEAGKTYKKIVKSGFTIVLPDKPVSLTQNIAKFQSKGFYKFLIDISYKSDVTKLSQILIAVKTSQKLASSSDFNMKKGLR